MAISDRTYRHLKYLAEKELGIRQDELVRAKLEYNRGLMQADQLADYENDVAFEKQVLQELEATMSETESRERAAERTDFEKWVTDSNHVGRLLGLERLGDSYRAEGVHKRWLVWQAAAQATRERIAKGIREWPGEKGFHPFAPKTEVCYELADAIEKGEIG